MRFAVHWPGSFLKLIWIGFFCVSFPLLLALVNASLFTGRLARQSGFAVQRAARAASDSRLLTDHLVSLERSARQFYVLGDPQQLERFTERRGAIHGTLRRLDGLLDNPAQKQRLQRILEIEEEIHGILSGGPHPKGAEVSALDRFVELNGLAREVVVESDRVATDEVDAMQAAAARTQRNLTWAVLALIPVTILVSALFAGLLSAPIRRIEQAIRRLGAGRFSSRITVGGPKDLEMLGERLDWLRQRLAELEAEKAKFLAHVSHELKTPLTAIREGVDILNEGVVGRLDAEQREVTTIIHDSTIRLQRLIENLLRFSVDRAKGVVSPSGAVALRPVVERVLGEHKPAILAKGIRLWRDLATVRVAGDPEAVRTIIDNLVSNAVKCTPKGGAVRVTLAAEEAVAVIEVADTGPGIPPEERRRVFEPFYQGAPQEGGVVQGSGLGLSIAAELVHGLEGSIEVGEAPAGGALLRVRLPLAVEA